MTLLLLALSGFLLGGAWSTWQAGRRGIAVALAVAAALAAANWAVRL